VVKEHSPPKNRGGHRGTSKYTYKDRRSEGYVGSQEEESKERKTGPIRSEDISSAGEGCLGGIGAGLGNKGERDTTNQNSNYKEKGSS